MNNYTYVTGGKFLSSSAAVYVGVCGDIRGKGGLFRIKNVCISGLIDI